jgi:beta-lactamase superfamily II metal-dependent hydrolase
MAEGDTGNPNTNEINSLAGDSSNTFGVHLLDVGRKQYGDAVLCRFGAVSVFIDGAHRGNYEDDGTHPSLPKQLRYLLGQTGPTSTVDLLVCTHLHDDHIGCLPELVKFDKLRARYALVIDPIFRWGEDSADTAAVASPAARALVEALSEEPREDIDEESFTELMADSESLYERYTRMLTTLEQRGTKVFRYGTDSIEPLQAYLQSKSVGLEVLGPRESDLPICARYIQQWQSDMLDRVESGLNADSLTDPLNIYREVVSQLQAADAPRSSGSFINLESLVLLFRYRQKNFLMTGDMQMADAETDDPDLREGRRVLLSKIEDRAPYEFVKLAHHGSWNGFSEEVLSNLGNTTLLGLCTGSESGHHPAPKVMQLLKSHIDELTWVRTDRNGQVKMDFAGNEPNIQLSRGELNDYSAPGGSPHDEAQVPDVADEPLVVTTSAATASLNGSEQSISLTLPKRARRITISIELNLEN